MEKTDVINQKVTVYDDGRIEIISNRGRYFNDEHSCVISDDFTIDSKSVKNLMLLFSKKNPTLKCISVDSRKNGWIYVNSDSIITDLEKENKELNSKLYDTEKELKYTKNLMMSLESSLNRKENELEEEKTKKWWENYLKGSNNNVKIYNN